MSGTPWGLDGPYYDDLENGYEFPIPTSVSLTSGVTAQYLAITGDALALSIDRDLCRNVTGREELLVSPALVLHMSIGASTCATRKVLANLFYRNVVLRAPVFVDESLTTRTRVAGLADTKPKPDSLPRGKVLLNISTTRHEDLILDYERCPLLPCRGDAAPGHNDDLGRAEADFDPANYPLGEIAGWDLTPLGSSETWAIGEVRADPLMDVVTGATELVRLSHNLAAVHRDVAMSPYPTRLVYGGHTISLAQASLVRVLPGLATVLGWISCDHVAPVFEGDLLSTIHTLDADSAQGPGRVRAIRSEVFAHREGQEPVKVLDWQPVVYTT